MAWGPGNHYFDFSPSNDGYVAPRDTSELIGEIENSTVTVFCDVSKTRGDSGTGWAIDPSVLQVDTTDTAIITNHHVIADCIGLEGSVSISKLYGKKRAAEISFFDKKNDLAVLETELKLKPIELSKNIPWPGYWAMMVVS